MIINETIPLPPLLIKVGEKKEYLEKFIYNGEVFFGSFSGYRGENELDYYNKLIHSVFNKEDDLPRSDFFRLDPLEGIESITYPQKNIYNQDVEFNFTQKHSHCFSVFGFNPELPIDFSINETMRKFGDYFTVFDSKEFLQCLHGPLLNHNISEFRPEYGFVKYYDLKIGQNISGLTQFHKKNHYGYQYEYRILASFPNTNEGYKIELDVDLNEKGFKLENPIYRIDELFKLEYHFKS